jgi:hypothetical protein
MPFGLVFLDHDGDLWTVDVRSPQLKEPGRRSLRFSRPTFLEPTEQRELDDVPPCWPDCTDDELRAFLAAALDASG